MKDGRISVAIEKERVTRLKHDGGNDTEAIQYCLDAEGITMDDVALVVQNANFGMFERGNGWWNGERVLNDRVPVVSISHHLAHAYSAIGTSPFDEAAIMIIDGCGSGLDECIDLEGAAVPEQPAAEVKHLYYEKDSYYIFKDNRVTPVYKDFSPWGVSIKRLPLCPNTTMHSIGGLYLGASMYVFSGFEDPGKLMGLAPYGRPGVYDFEIFDLRDGRAFVRYDWMSEFDRPAHSYEEFKANFQYYADLAWWVQREVERAILYLMNARYDLAGSENLAYAGGVALNAVANRRILRESRFSNVYIQPAAGDNGLAIGCAYYGWQEVLKRERVKHDGTSYFGKTYEAPAVAKAISTHKARVSVSDTEDFIEETARHLADGKIVGWFQGGSEFGPRALGNRSILADPRKPEMRRLINSLIKFREDFRPFAPSVIAEEVGVYFDCDYESPHMILVAPVRPEWKEVIPSVVHQDQSCRIQTVTQSSNPTYYRLLRAFKERTGIAVLLNTSFNRRGMPIVETPEQALGFYLACDLDVLALNQCVISKARKRMAADLDLAKYFNQDLKQALERNWHEARMIGGIYQVSINSVQTWTIDLTSNQPTISEGALKMRPSTVVHLAEADFQKYQSNPEVEGLNLLQTGRLKINGSQEQLMKVSRILRFTE